MSELLDWTGTLNWNGLLDCHIFGFHCLEGNLTYHYKW